MNIDELNRKFGELSVEERIQELYHTFDKVLVTSSFGTSSVVLLSFLAKVNPRQKIFFLNTTFHFPETLKYKEELSNKLGLEIEELKPDEWKNEFTRKDQTWLKDPDLCCSINKVEPLNKVKKDYQVWVSGLMSWQTKNRGVMNLFTETQDILKFHPLMDVTEEEMNAHVEEYQLPRHPLERKGYSSIGCAQCTKKGKGRAGRWVDKSKEECGLHGK